ncbi:MULTISPECIES: DUF2189 domain-containing protein [Alphaproteobacteria]|uniref:Membrane protein n=2 Tax=Alphaproteobacteria TaxID=28211 RepID=A0A512HN00_9HYPH|nr:MULTISPECIES: DUF2189 domain-containing protein [Alphaproteobacteria]GEO86821.1 membrane protein [Ciceribacter naphthalenivorans]GLR23401.1 membrane protein [Ciceribacter naphthalenivorans]GLT06257.1 membrane protein [Sphingomonas psychrolutea]
MEEQVIQAPPQPKMRINHLEMKDVAAALAEGVRDFRRFPLFGLFFGGIYVLGGIFIVAVLNLYHQPWMIIPVAIGFPLIGPFVAVGLYEISRRHERGDPITWHGVLTEVFRQRERQLSWMAFAVLFIFWIWIYQVRLLLALFLGFKIPASLAAFTTIVTTTPEGILFLLVGTIVGGVIATLLFSLTVISMPLLLDHDIDFVTAMLTSIRTVTQNPAPMLAFGLVVAVTAFLALLPAFAGLLVALPVLGHSTWHLYRRAITTG